MKLIQRIGYYLGGFALGLIILAFFFNRKRTSCSYGPEARVIKNIKSKNLVYAPSIVPSDTILIDEILKNGNINFSESEPRKKPCSVYLIESDYKDQLTTIIVENCDSVATILKIKK